MKNTSLLTRFHSYLYLRTHHYSPNRPTIPRTFLHLTYKSFFIHLSVQFYPYFPYDKGWLFVSYVFSWTFWFTRPTKQVVYSQLETGVCGVGNVLVEYLTHRKNHFYLRYVPRLSYLWKKGYNHLDEDDVLQTGFNGPCL